MSSLPYSVTSNLVCTVFFYCLSLCNSLLDEKKYVLKNYKILSFIVLAAPDILLHWFGWKAAEMKRLEQILRKPNCIITFYSLLPKSFWSLLITNCNEVMLENISTPSFTHPSSLREHAQTLLMYNEITIIKKRCSCGYSILFLPNGRNRSDRWYWYVWFILLQSFNMGWKNNSRLWRVLCKKSLGLEKYQCFARAGHHGNKGI